MRRVWYSVAMSLDGFIANRNGEVDWIVVDPDIDFQSLFSKFDTVLMGRKTYEESRRLGGADGGMPGLSAYVISRTLAAEDCPGATLIDTPRETLAALKQQPGKEIWLMGGGLLFRALLEMGLVDRVEVAILPILLGGGVPMLPHRADSSRLQLVNHTVYPKTGTVLLEYEPA